MYFKHQGLVLLKSINLGAHCLWNLNFKDCQWVCDQLVSTVFYCRLSPTGLTICLLPDLRLKVLLELRCEDSPWQGFRLGRSTIFALTNSPRQKVLNIAFGAGLYNSDWVWQNSRMKNERVYLFKRATVWRPYGFLFFWHLLQIACLLARTAQS